MKKRLLLFVCALIAFSAAPAMAGKKLNIRVYNQHTDYTIYWRRTMCDCVSYCDHLPGGTIRPRDMWPPGDEPSAQIESKDSADNYCASQPSWIGLEFSTDPDFKNSGSVVYSKSVAAWHTSHWHKYQPCGTTNTIDIFCTLDEGSNDNLDIRLEALSTGGSKPPATGVPAQAGDKREIKMLPKPVRGQAANGATYWTTGVVGMLSSWESPGYWVFGFASDSQWSVTQPTLNILQSQGDVAEFLGVNSANQYTAYGDDGTCYGIFTQSFNSQRDLTFYFDYVNGSLTFTSVKECEGVTLRSR